MHESLSTPLSKLLGSPAKQGDLGVELEVEGRNLPTEGLTGWSIKAEDSLRGDNGRVVRGDGGADTPREYVSARPVGLDTLRTRLNELHGALTREPSAVRLTYRASTHIHINMGNETLATLLAFMAAFAAAEPVLLRLCGPERNGNSFCMPFYETGDAVTAVNALMASAVNGVPFRGRGKYASLNIDPLTTYGSVEVRCFPNSITPETIHSWANWLINLREIARAATQDSPNFGSMIDEIIVDPERFLESVFGDYDRNACRPHNPSELTLFGAETAYEIWKAAQPLFAWTEGKKKLFKEPEENWDIPRARPPRPLRYVAPAEMAFAPAVLEEPEAEGGR